MPVVRVLLELALLGIGLDIQLLFRVFGPLSLSQDCLCSFCQAIQAHYVFLILSSYQVFFSFHRLPLHFIYTEHF